MDDKHSSKEVTEVIGWNIVTKRRMVGCTREIYDTAPYDDHLSSNDCIDILKPAVTSIVSYTFTVAVS
jgi:hypothetical protein